MARYRKLGPVEVARIKRAARCPDCDSTVRVDQAQIPPHVTTQHDDTCPAFAALERQRRTAQIMLPRRSDQTGEEFAEEAAKFIQRVAAEREHLWPGSLALRVAVNNPYTDLGGLAG